MWILQGRKSYLREGLFHTWLICLALLVKVYLLLLGSRNYFLINLKRWGPRALKKVANIMIS